MLTEEQLGELDYCKKMISIEVGKVVAAASKIKDKLEPEAIVSIIYLKTFSSYLQDKKIENIGEFWVLMNDTRGIVEKISYVSHYLDRLTPPSQASA